MKKNALKYTIAVMFDNIGSSLTTFILPLLVLDISGSAIHLSIIGVFTTLPFLIFGIPFGIFVDNANLKKILNYSDLIRAVVYFVLGLIFLLDYTFTVQIIGIYFATLIASIINVLNSIAEVTFIPEITEEKDFNTMNSIIFGLQYISGIIMPVIGGYIYNHSNIYGIFFLNSVTYVFSALLIYKIKYQKEKKEEQNRRSAKDKYYRFLIDLKKGLFYLHGRMNIVFPLITVAIFNLLTANFQNNVLIFLKMNNSFDSSNVGFILAFATIGSLLGSLVSNKLTNTYSFKKLFLYNIVLQVFLRTIFFFVNHEIGYSLILFGVYLLSSILNILIITNRQKQVEKEFLGRVNSIYKTVLIGVNSFGFLLGGLLIEYLGNNTAFQLLMIIQFIFVLFFVPLGRKCLKKL